jgi:aspartate/methionine/tyrosine aminotransferase
MDIEPFALERFFAEHEAGADLMLAESGVRSLSAARFDTAPGELGYVVPTAGDPDFRAAVGSLHDRSAVETLFTCGTQEANFLAFLGTVESHAVVVTPTYGSLTAVPRSLGEVTEVPLGEDWRLDPDAVVEALRPETDLVVLNNPNNPTGRYHDESAVRAVYDACADNDTYLLCDEVYRLLADEPIPPVAGFGEYGLSTAGVSKPFGLAGLRFGWLCGPESVVERAERWKDYTTISPPKIGQHVARQAFDEREELLAESRALAADHRAVVADFLDERGLAWSNPDCGVNALVEVPDGFPDGETFCRQFVAEESVVLAPGEAFGLPGRFRIGYGLPLAELEEGLARLERFLETHD